jgi:hypothetical protein
MEPGLMLRAAVILLAITGGGGILMAGLRFSGRPYPPDWLAMVHGLLAASGLTLVLYVAFTAGLPVLAWWGLAAMGAASVGGVILNLNYHVDRAALPIWLVLGHAALALAGWIMFAMAAWRQ